MATKGRPLNLTTMLRMLSDDTNNLKQIDCENIDRLVKVLEDYDVRTVDRLIALLVREC